MDLDTRSVKKEADKSPDDEKEYSSKKLKTNYGNGFPASTSSTTNKSYSNSKATYTRSPSPLPRDTKNGPYASYSPTHDGKKRKR